MDPKEQMEKNKKRMQELVNAFKNGQNFVIHGNLSLSGCVELPDGFHKTPEYDGFIYESGFSDLFSKTPFIQKVLLQAKKTKKPVLVLDSHLIYEITPCMTLKKAMEKQEQTKEKFDAFLDGYDQAQADVRNNATEKYQTLSIVNQPLWDKLIEENRNAPLTDFVPKNFSTDSESRIQKLQLYARILEGNREKDGRITPSVIAYADDISDLSFDLKKMSRNDPTLPELRFEGLRFWADVILAKTWKYGEELLATEGFSPEEIKDIKTNSAIPTRYTYWEALSHPYMRDLRVTTFYRGESEPTIQSSHKSRKINLSKEHQKD